MSVNKSKDSVGKSAKIRKTIHSDGSVEYVMFGKRMIIAKGALGVDDALQKGIYDLDLIRNRCLKHTTVEQWRHRLKHQPRVIKEGYRRHMLRQLGFVEVQVSLWMHPDEYEEMMAKRAENDANL